MKYEPIDPGKPASSYTQSSQLDIMKSFIF